MLAPLGQRFGSYLLDMVVMIMTLGIGWFVWGAMTAADGQTPGKKLTGLVVVDKNTGQPLDWGRYVILRGAVGGVVGVILNYTIIGLLHVLLPIFDSHRQFVWGKISNSVVAVKS